MESKVARRAVVFEATSLVLLLVLLLSDVGCCDGTSGGEEKLT